MSKDLQEQHDRVFRTVSEENKGAAVALPATDYTLAIPARPYEPAYVTNEEGFSAEAMLAFRAEGEANLRACLAVSEALVHDLAKDLERVRAQRDEAVAALRVAVEDAADEWARHVVEDTAPRPLTNHMLREFDLTLASLKEQAA